MRNRDPDPKRPVTFTCKGGGRINRKEKSFQEGDKLRESLCQEGEEH